MDSPSGALGLHRLITVRDPIFSEQPLRASVAFDDLFSNKCFKGGTRLIGSRPYLGPLGKGIQGHQELVLSYQQNSVVARVHGKQLKGLMCLN